MASPSGPSGQFWSLRGSLLWPLGERSPAGRGHPQLHHRAPQHQRVIVRDPRRLKARYHEHLAVWVPSLCHQTPSRLHQSAHRLARVGRHQPDGS
eukprot:6178795-Pleurochrysis_carterae.AAC.2